MATRNVLDSLGNVIGTLTLPDTTTEDQWTAALSIYSATFTPISGLQVIGTKSVSATGTVTTSSGTATVISGMSIQPAKGKYLVFFNGSIYTAGASAVGEFGIYVDGTFLQETRRDVSCNLTLLGGLVTVSVNAIGVGTCTGTEVVMDGSKTIDVRFRSTNGGTIGFNERTLNLLKVQE